jgi:hypothetical protein
MKTLLLFLSLSLPAHAFILTDRNYALKFDEYVKVYVSSEGCVPEGIPDGELADVIKEVIEKYWNTVPESRLKLKYGGKSSASVDNGTPRSGILIGCGTLSGADGAASNNKSRGSSVIVLNDSTISGSTSTARLVGLIAHEMGHSIGLNHSKDKASVMTYESHGWGPKPSYLSRDDKDGVIYLYPNESKVMGVVPSCESFADDGSGTAKKNFFPTLLFGFLLAGFITWRWRRS